MLRKILALLFPPVALDCSLLPLDIKQEAFSDNVSIITFFDYKNEAVKNLILTLKENESPELLNNLAKFVFESLIIQISQITQISDKEIYLIPIPARKQRLEEFGFNQTELFCRALSKLVPHSKTIPLVYRTKEISKQAHKNKSQREQEINYTMNYKQKIPDDISGTSLFIVVDDVVTTGSTLREVLRVLKLAGAKQVLMLALARA